MSRLARFVSLAVLVALSSLVASAQGGADAQARKKFDHKQKITSRYDAKSDTTIVSFFLKQPNGLARLAGGGPSAGAAFGEDVGIAVSFSHPGKSPASPVETAEMWVAYTGGGRTGVGGELRASVDGHELILSPRVSTAASGLRGGEQKVRSVSLRVARGQLARVAGGAKAVLILPSGERITLGREQLNALADFTSRMAP